MTTTTDSESVLRAKLALEWERADNDKRWDLWRRLPERERSWVRDLSGLTAQLVGLEGKRVEVENTYDNEKRRFWVENTLVDSKAKGGAYGGDQWGATLVKKTNEQLQAFRADLAEVYKKHEMGLLPGECENSGRLLICELTSWELEELFAAMPIWHVEKLPTYREMHPEEFEEREPGVFYYIGNKERGT